MEKLEPLCTAGMNVKFIWKRLWKTEWCFLKKSKKRITIWSNNSTSGYISKRIENKDLKREFYTRVHSSIIYNSQKLEATQVSIKEWTDKQNVVYKYNAIFFSLKKGYFDTCCNMDEPWRHYAKWSKLFTKEQILYDSTYWGT